MALFLFSLLLASFCSCFADQFRGVNIGGWLVLESWITPDLFRNNSVPVSHPLLPGAPPSNGPGEWGFCAALGKTKAKQALTKHWDTWVNFDHLQTLAASGVNFLRVPVGYWIVDIQLGEPFVEGGLQYLQRLLGWAHQLGLKVLVDLHAAPGSQNGHDNSGRTGPIHWNTPANINRTVAVLVKLAQALEKQPAFAALELMNEPWTTYVGGPIQISTLKSFYLDAYAALRKVGYAGDIVMSDGWSWGSWDDFMPPPAYQNVYLDTHLYRCFGGGDLQPYQNVQSVCGPVRQQIDSETRSDWRIIGEFSLCLTNSTIATSAGWNKFAAFYIASQQTAFGCRDGSDAPVKGSFFWNFRIGEGEDYAVRLEWDYLLGLQLGYMPQSSAQWNINGCP